ncbi:MAG: ATP-binding protein [Aliarcobacter sp.]|nr:ATP-binding protein [Aliarcobacter sp.]
MTRNIYNKYSGMEVKRLLEKGILILRYADKDEYVFYDKILNLLVKGSKTTVETEISRELGIYCKIVEDAYKAHKKNNYNSNFIYYEIFNIPLITTKQNCWSEDKFIKNKDDKTYIENINVLTLYMKPIADDSLDKYSDLDSKIFKFLNTITKSDKSQNIAMFLSKMICEPSETKCIILIGDKNVSLIFQENILNPIYGDNICFLTEENLIHSNMNDLLENYNIFYVNFIPQSEEGKNKLKELTYKISSNQRLNTNYHNEQYYSGYIIFALETPDDFLKNFTSFYQVYFLNDLPKILELMSLKNDLELHKSISSSLIQFSCQLKYLHKNKDSICQAKDDNSEFLEILKDTRFDSLQNNNSFDILTVQNLHNVIPPKERYKHTYITGMTGSGKSELLKVLIMGDILRENGSIILLEPHGDLAQSVTKLVKDKSRLVYINPFLDDEKTPTINLFHLPNKSEQNIAKITQVILSVLKSVNSDESFTGAMEDVLEMCIKVLLRRGKGSFKELYRFLNDNRNKDLVELGINSPNQLEVEFFEDDFLNSKPTKDAVRRRLKKLLNDPVFSNLMNGENTINLEELMNEKGKVIIFNIPKGKMPNTYKYYIRFIVEYIQVLALKRADLSEEDRIHTHLYIDEAHNFISSTATISEILTESRKYKLFVTFAHQAITQIKNNNLRDIMTTMTNVKIVGKNSNKTLEAINKTLNTKLEDVEKLEAGEFYISAGNNDIIKVNVTDNLIDGKEDISSIQEEEQIDYQLEKYYRDIENLDDSLAPSEQLKQKLDDFINAIKSLDIEYFNKIQDVPKIYEEFIYNLNDETDNAIGYISKQDLSLYFNLIYPETPFEDNKLLLKLLKTRDDFFKQNVNSNKTYNSKKRYLIS